MGVLWKLEPFGKSLCALRVYFYLTQCEDHSSVQHCGLCSLVKGNWMKESEGIRQITYKHNPQTDNSVVMGRGKGGWRLGGGGQKGRKLEHL